MKITKSKRKWFGFTNQSEERQAARDEGPQKARCIHCYKQFRTTYGFHVTCKACRTEEDYRRSFEWALSLAQAKA